MYIYAEERKEGSRFHISSFYFFIEHSLVYHFLSPNSYLCLRNLTFTLTTTNSEILSGMYQMILGLLLNNYLIMKS